MGTFHELNPGSGKTVAALLFFKGYLVEALAVSIITDNYWVQ